MLRWIALAILLVLPPVTGAHHGWSGYDLSKEFTITAVIERTSFDWPHVTIWVKPSGDSAARVWTATLAPPSRMETRGAPAKLLQPGVTVRLTGYPSRSDPSEFRAERIWIGEKKVELR
jgi:hypothetical protein